MSQPGFPSGAGAGRAREPERSLGEVVKDIVSNVQEIVRSEVRLASVEMREKAVSTLKAGVKVAVGAVIGLYCLGFLLITIYKALNLVVAPWLSALFLFIVLGIIAAVLLAGGIRRIRNIKAKPERTVQSVKEDVEWIRNRKR